MWGSGGKGNDACHRIKRAVIVPVTIPVEQQPNRRDAH